MLRTEEPAAETPTDFWGSIVAYWTENWDVFVGNTIAVISIVLIALLVRWILHFVIDRVVTQIVTGVKRKQDVTDTQARQRPRSPPYGSFSARARSARCSRTS